MSRQPRRLLLTLALLILGAVFGHAAEHEGWFHGVFHAEAGEGCPDSGAGCPASSHDHAACECHGHDQGVMPAASLATAAATSGELVPAPVPFVAWAFAPAPELAPPLSPPTASPPRCGMAGCAPLLV